jgi:hypothetical protein
MINDWVSLETVDGDKVTININSFVWINKSELFIHLSDCSRLYITKESMKFLCDFIGITWRDDNE